MKKIFLVRHAQASWLDFTKTDFARSIDQDSHLDCQVLNSYLEENKILPELILHSPAQRIRETLALLPYWTKNVENIQMVEDIYHAETSFLFELINSLDNKLNRIAIVGHNPALSGLVYVLTDCARMHMTAGAIATIESAKKNWAQIDFGTAKILDYFQAK